MAQSINLGSDLYIDSTGVMLRSASPTRKTLAEFASGLNNTKAITISGNDSVRLKLEASTTMFMLSTGPSAAVTGAYGFICTANGVAKSFPVTAASGFTITNSSNYVRIANGNSNAAVALLLIVAGDAVIA